MKFKFMQRGIHLKLKRLVANVVGLGENHHVDIECADSFHRGIGGHK